MHLSLRALRGISGQGIAAAAELHSALDYLDELEAGKYFMLSSSVASGRPMSSSNLAMHPPSHMEQMLPCSTASSDDAGIQTDPIQACGCQQSCLQMPGLQEKGSSLGT